MPMHEPSERLRSQVDRAFKYHPPHSDQALRYEELRAAARALGILFMRMCPESREQALAFTHLETSVMWANAAIARNEPAPEPAT